MLQLFLHFSLLLLLMRMLCLSSLNFCSLFGATNLVVVVMATVVTAGTIAPHANGNWIELLSDWVSNVSLVVEWPQHSSSSSSSIWWWLKKQKTKKWKRKMSTYFQAAMSTRANACTTDAAVNISTVSNFHTDSLINSAATARKAITARDTENWAAVENVAIFFGRGTVCLISIRENVVSGYFPVSTRHPHPFIPSSLNWSKLAAPELLLLLQWTHCAVHHHHHLKAVRLLRVN